MDDVNPWLEFASGDKIYISEICTLGRTPGNKVIIPSERVSRRHAVIRRGSDGAFEILDMGSSNGTYLNGQRISRPARLQDGWVIEIGMQKITFRLPPAVPEEAVESEGISEPCWLLVVEAALLGGRTPSDDIIGKTIESWSERCERVVRKFRGRVLRAVNEGMLAYWRTGNGEGSAATVATVLQTLRAVQLQTEEFRFALHYGEATLRRGASGEWKPTGNEVIFMLQLQRLVSEFGTSVLITDPARELLEAAVPIRQLTVAELRTYRGSQRFHTLREENPAR